MARSRRKDRERQTEGGRRRTVAGGGDFLEGYRQADLIVVGGFLVLTLVLFLDFVFSDSMLFGSDTVPSGIFFRGLYRDFVRAFKAMPMWDRYILGGLPFVDAMHGDTFYPTAVLQFLLPLHRALGYKLILHVFLAGAGMYFFLKAFGLRRCSALFGGLCYMFAPTFVTFVFAGQDAKMYVIALLPYQFYCLERGFRSLNLRPFLMLGGITGLSILSSHNQMAYFALWGLGLYFLFRLYFLIWTPRGDATDRKSDAPGGAKGELYRDAGRVAGFFGVALALALAVGAVQLLPTYIYVQNYSVRGTAEKTSFEHATSFSLHPEEIASLIVPEFGGYADKASDTYWGRNPFKLNSEYAGILPVIFAVFALVFRKDRRGWFFLGGGGLALVYAVTYHTPFFRLCYELIPGVKNFRSQGMIAFLYAFCICTLGAVGVERVLDRPQDLRQERRYRILRVAGWVALAGGGIAILFTRSCLDLWISLFYSDIAPEKRQALDAVYPGIRTGAIIGLAIALTSVAVARAKMRQSIPVTWFIAVLSVLALIDTWRIDRRFIQVVDPNTLRGFRTDGVIADLQKRQTQEGPFRVLDLTGVYEDGHKPNELGAHRIETVGGLNGFHDNELRWYRRFRGENDARLLEGLSIGSDGQLRGVGKNPFLNLLNVRYVVYRPDPNSPVQILENRDCLGRAFIASTYQVVKGGADGVLGRLADRESDFRNVVLLEEYPHWGDMPGGEGGAGVVQAIRYEGDLVNIQVRMYRRGILVLSDNYFPYWRATDNGKGIPIVRAYAALRALSLEAGDHLVQFAYVSRPYETGKWITWISVLFIFILIRYEWLRGLTQR